MNKIITAVLTCATITSINAQQLQNSNFESWSVQGSVFQYDSPGNWNTLASSTSGVSANHEKVSGADAHNGFAIKLETKTLAGQTANGIVTNGNIVTTPPYGVNGGVSYAFRPDSLVGWYKATPASGDFATMELVLLGNSSDTIGWARFEAPSATVASYIRFSAPVQYFNSSTPVKAIALFSSSNGFSAVNGSKLFIDDIQLIFNPVSTHEVFTQTKRIEIYPVPASQFVRFNVLESLGTLTILDVSGNIIAREYNLTSAFELDCATLSSGMYLYRFDTHSGETTSGKFAVNH